MSLHVRRLISIHELQLKKGHSFELATLQACGPSPPNLEGSRFCLQMSGQVLPIFYIVPGFLAATVLELRLSLASNFILCLLYLPIPSRARLQAIAPGCLAPKFSRQQPRRLAFRVSYYLRHFCRLSSCSQMSPLGEGIRQC